MTSALLQPAPPAHVFLRPGTRSADRCGFRWADGGAAATCGEPQASHELLGWRHAEWCTAWAPCHEGDGRLTAQAVAERRSGR